MEINEKLLSKKDIDKIHKNLSVSVETDYGKPKMYKIYDYNYSLKTYNIPLYWASKNISNFIEPHFKQSNFIEPGRFLGKPRPHQIECMNECLKELNKNWGGGIINMETGSGKSFSFMMIFHHKKLKTLIVVHTTELMEQWIKNIRKFLPDVSIGKIQGKTFDIKNKQIVVGMLQTISMKQEYSKDLFEEFGIVVYDEVQFLSAEVFSKALLKSRVRYTFGLSATVERKDGLEWVFKAHIGDILYSNISTSLKQYTKIKYIFVEQNQKEKFMYDGSPNISGMITDISQNYERTKMICKQILNLEKDKNILVLSERVEHLKVMHNILGDEISGIFIGNMKQKDKDISKTKKILLATYHIASVGFDHPKLNTLVFATPRSNITQAIGRIYRRIHEITPMIIDIVDTYSVFNYQYKKRKMIYSKNIKEQIEDSECLFD